MTKCAGALGMLIPSELLVHDLLELAKTAEQHMKASGEVLTALAERLQPSPQVKQDAISHV